MWLVGKGRLKLKVEQCRDDTPTPITNLIRQCTEYDHEKRPNFAPEVCVDVEYYSVRKRFIFPFRLMILCRNLNLFFHVYNVHNQNLV